MLLRLKLNHSKKADSELSALIKSLSLFFQTEQTWQFFLHTICHSLWITLLTVYYRLYF